MLSKWQSTAEKKSTPTLHNIALSVQRFTETCETLHFKRDRMDGLSFYAIQKYDQEVENHANSSRIPDVK